MSPGYDPGSQNLPLNLMLTLASLVIIVGGMRAGADLLIPILLSLFIAVICTSPVHWLHERAWHAPVRAGHATDPRRAG